MRKIHQTKCDGRNRTIGYCLYRIVNRNTSILLNMSLLVGITKIRVHSFARAAYCFRRIFHSTVLLWYILHTVPLTSIYLKILKIENFMSEHTRTPLNQFCHLNAFSSSDSGDSTIPTKWYSLKYNLRTYS